MHVTCEAAYHCPICLEAPVAARLTKCGHVYCWPCLQVRAPRAVSGRAEGKDFIVASASLDLDALKALGEAIAGLLRERAP